MQRAHEDVVAEQFGPRAKAYVESAVHAQGEDLAALETIVGPGQTLRSDFCQNQPEQTLPLRNDGRSFQLV